MAGYSPTSGGRAGLNYGEEELGNTWDEQRKAAEDAQNRNAPGMDWGQANNDYQSQIGARTQQEALASNYQNVLTGNAPSVAMQQQQMGLQAAQNSAASLANSTRGGELNRMLAQRQAVDVQAQQQQVAVNSAILLRAQEQAQAREGMGNVLGQIRGQDQSSRGQSQEQTEAVAKNDLAQRGLNDAMTESAWGNQAQTAGNLFSGQVGMRGQDMGQQAAQAQMRAQQQARGDQWLSAGLGAVGAVGGGMLGGPVGGALGGAAGKGVGGAIAQSDDSDDGKW